MSMAEHDVAPEGGPLARLGPLRPEASTPLWLQLKHALRDLATFHLAAGDRLPSEAEIGARFAVSRVTVRLAVTALVDEGILHRQQGRGTFVLPPRLAEPPPRSGHFLLSHFDRRDGSVTELHEAGTAPAAEWIAERLGLAQGAPVHKIRQILSHDGAPVAFRTTFASAALLPNLLQADFDQPFHDILERDFGLDLAEADETIELIAADDFRADLLKVEVNHPLILVERLVYLTTGEAADFSRAYYIADKIRFQRRLRPTR